MQKKQQLVPRLRFLEYSDVWKSNIISELASKLNVGFVGTCEPFYTNKEDGVLLIRTGNLKGVKIIIEDEKYVTKSFHEKNTKSQIFAGDLLLARHGSKGEICLIPDGFPEANCLNIVILRIKYKFDSKFFQLIYGTYSIQKQINAVTAGSTQAVINTKEIGKLKVNYPILQEQQKIANFLTAIDKRIQTIEKKKSLLVQYKKGVMQKIFRQELRFKPSTSTALRASDGNVFPKWEKIQLSGIAERIKTKNKIDNQNVLTISAQLGLISQLEYFNKSVSAKNLTGYYLIERNDFAYNKSYSKGYPMGAIKRLNKYNLGVVSTLYICFRFNEKVSLDFMEQYFDAGLQNREIEKVAQEGARNHGLLNIGVNDFFEIDLKIPSLPEQLKIAKFLSAIDKNIALVTKKIDKTKAYKKGLLQQMFV